MCFTGGSSWLNALTGNLLTPKASTPSTPTVSSPATDVSTTSADALNSSNDAKRKAALAQGQQSTIATSSQGDTSTATTNKKTLLGS
jgi:CCR4-NOT transcriptional regulation complex NOT5 subunit